jgi:hypothetical protein
MTSLYHDLAHWWPLISAPEDYAEEAAFYRRALLARADGPCETMLELGSGGGNNASHLKARFRMTLVEPSAGMLAVSRALNPELEHVQGDMRTVRLDRTFDSVFVHDAVCYMTTEPDLRAAMTTAALHCRLGGVLLMAPDYVRETFRPGTDHGGHDGQGRSARYLEWTWDPDPDDTTCIADYTLVLRDSSGDVQVEHDRHVEGLFPRSTWLRLLDEAGFEARAVPLEHSEVEAGVHEIFLGRRVR